MNITASGTCQGRSGTVDLLYTDLKKLDSDSSEANFISLCFLAFQLTPYREERWRLVKMVRNAYGMAIPQKNLRFFLENSR